MKRSRVFFLLSVLLIPATLWLGTRLSGRSYYLIGTLVMLETMLPFFAAFEHRRPKAREIVTLAVMCALAVAARVVVPLPHFKPITAIIMITGIAFGCEAGFLTGAVSAFASNFFLSQGPWTPWQMAAYGAGGFLAGLFFHRCKKRPKPALLAAFGFVTILFLVGPILDSCTLFTMSTHITAARAAAVFAAGFPTNLKHAAACAITLFLAADPLLDKLERLQRKYGMMKDD